MRASSHFKTKTKFALALSGWVALVAGCANVIGLSDVKDKDTETLLPGGNRGGGGMGGMGGKGMGGKAGMGGMPGGMPSGGKGGMSGMGGMPGVVGCDGTPFTPNDAIVRSCILRNSCYPLLPDFTISDCVTYNYQNDLGAFSCTKTAQTCTDVQECLGSGFVDQATCDSGATLSFCDQNQAINCAASSNDISYFRDCDILGGTCDLMVDGSANCRVVDSCVGTASGCGGLNNNFLYTCDGGKGFGFDCDAIVATCETTPDTACYYQASPCNGDSIQCVGDTIDECSGGNQRQYECGGVGLSCVEDGTNVDCLAPGCTTLDYVNCTENCFGSIMSLCYGGVPYTVDCQDYGFDTCQVWAADGVYFLDDYVSCY
jgi:hypothetical protein